MKKIILVALLMLLLTGLTVQAEENPVKPLFVWMEDDFNISYGTDSPYVVLYDNGLLILRDELLQPKEGSAYFTYTSQMLDEETLAMWVEAIQNETVFELNDAEDYYNLIYATEQPMNHFFMWNAEDEIKHVRMYGNLMSAQNDWIEYDEAPPAPMQTLLDMVFELEKGDVWQPEIVDLMIFEVDEPASKALEYTIEDTSLFEEYSNGLLYPITWEEFLDLNGDLTATSRLILIEDTVYRTWFRFAFPEEDLWMEDYPLLWIGFLGGA